MDKPPPPRPALVVHAGAWSIPLVEQAAHQGAVRDAVAVGWKVLEAGGSAIDGVMAALTTLESVRW